MRYKILTPRYAHVLGLIINCAILIGLTFIFKEAIMSEELEGAILISIVITFDIFWFLFFVNRFIYARIDLDKGSFLYGNLFFNEEVSVSTVIYAGKFLFFRRIVKVQIGKKKYYVNSFEEGVEKLLSKKQRA